MKKKRNGYFSCDSILLEKKKTKWDIRTRTHKVVFEAKMKQKRNNQNKQRVWMTTNAYFVIRMWIVIGVLFDLFIDAWILECLTSNLRIHYKCSRIDCDWWWRQRCRQSFIHKKKRKCRKDARERDFKVKCQLPLNAHKHFDAVRFISHKKNRLAFLLLVAFVSFIDWFQMWRWKCAAAIIFRRMNEKSEFLHVLHRVNSMPLQAFNVYFVSIVTDWSRS